ncbi:MAG: thioredoxin domain-containing protein [Marinilabiliales bacterium]|nr:thioredoxin domain-containing protein [Marinilabiliales bacterium]
MPPATGATSWPPRPSRTTETADYLNANFISIKVDREQRPDIDQYMMHFIQALTGSGGWPLNVFLTADLRAGPCTHLRTGEESPAAGSPFLSIAQAVIDYLQSNGNSIRPFSANGGGASACRCRET